jgi:histidine ammonia-lyase
MSILYFKSVSECRPHAGGMVTSRIMRGLVPPGQSIKNDQDVQDPYSLRSVSRN